MALVQKQEVETVESLTEAAHAAASRGEWNLAVACYERRGGLLAQSELSSAVVSKVQALDREVAERARLAQAVTASFLCDAGLLRQRLRDLRHRVALPPIESGTITRHV